MVNRTVLWCMTVPSSRPPESGDGAAGAAAADEEHLGACDTSRQAGRRRRCGFVRWQEPSSPCCSEFTLDVQIVEHDDSKVEIVVNFGGARNDKVAGMSVKVLSKPIRRFLVLIMDMGLSLSAVCSAVGSQEVHAASYVCLYSAVVFSGHTPNGHPPSFLTPPTF